MIVRTGLTGAGAGSAAGFSLERCGNTQAPLLAAATAAPVFILPTAIGGVFS